ncbi:hypothetical protein BDF19DRAFT_421592 [Syncephalis fuscata]|nr:hypothetical protein BDF19DRAFT_421592 [Syncephalis fuscata]
MAHSHDPSLSLGLTTGRGMHFNSYDWRYNSLSKLIIVILAAIQCSNFQYAIRLLYKHRRQLFLINVIPSLLGMVACIAALSSELFPRRINCNVVGYANVTVVAVGTPAMAIILMAKAYTGASRTAWFRCIATLVILGNVAVGLAGYFSFSMDISQSGLCSSTVEINWVVGKSVIDLVTNITLVTGFTLAFLLAKEWQRKQLRRALIRDGLLYAVLAAAANILTAVLILSSWDTNAWKMHLYGLDCK